MTSSEVEDLNEHNSFPADCLAKSSEQPLEHEVSAEKGENVDGDVNEDEDEGEDEGEYSDEDEEEDVDFNPLLKETPSQEVSSSLSSEIEGFEADSEGNVTSPLATDSKAKPLQPVHDYPTGDTDQGEEIVTQTSPPSLGAYQKGLDSGLLHGKSDGSGSKMDIINDLVVEELNNMGHAKKPVLDLDDDGAICMRTRARYSLVNFALDELETFLQETDDDDDLHNVDDEEEYRKFLAAVLQGGDADSQNVQDNENVDDEDEENDADFELELEEALESDVDEDMRDEIQDQVYEAAGRRPKTRQNRRQKASTERNKKLLGQLKRPLRPLLPNALITREPFSALDGKSFMLNHAPDILPPVNDGSINGFTPHQIGQLHCLIHEHVQLLIQAFSICVLEPSRGHVATKVQEMILEMLHIRNHVLAWRRLPYPSFCFFPPHVHPSMPNESSRLLMPPRTNESSAVDVLRSCPSGNNVVPPDIISTSKGRSECPRNGHNPEASPWAPYINGPVLSILDVAPLRLVGNYIEDVYAVVQDYHRRQVDVACETRFEKEPLFPLHNSQASAEPSDQVLRTAYPTSNMALSPSKSDRTPKMSMASALVERAKKQSVAPVPKEIAKLAQRFYPLFNPALYPHKPPPAAVANRVLFTDAEDELLALGLMEYNTDWKAIQQRFLPCKSKHQIFVRQKNRSSSKAPENPIKAVRRMKSSPLTAEEIVRIQEGLKTCKLDWMSIWKFIVPYRDPSLLPRQWRISNGTQKSYKSDANKKAKRRLYELRQRKCKSAASANWHTSSEKEDNNADKASDEDKNRNNQADREDEAYVHEAFLADWRPGTSNVTSKSPDLRPGEKPPPIQPLLPESSQVRQLLDNSGTRDFQPPVSNEFQTAARSSSISQSCPRAYRARRFNHSRLVKLAPDLPPVNLPPSVRVMSQSAFKSYQGGTSSKASVVSPGAESGVPNVVNCSANLGLIYPVKVGQVRNTPVNNGSSNRQPHHSVIRNKQVSEEKDESDLQMHPLLFQAPEDGHFPYYALNSSATTSSSFNFFSGSPPQLNLTLFHNQRPASHAVNFLEKSLNLKESTSSFGVDFHPLLQKSDDTICSTVGAQSANLDSSEDRCAQLSTTPMISRVNQSPSAASVRPISPNEKINELDLDIRLSFTSRRHKVLGIRDVNECSMARSVAGPLDSSRLGSAKASDSLNQCSQYMPAACTPDRTISKLNSHVRALDVSGHGRNHNNVDNIEDQCLPEIVMEQEELSDSEDEIGENVEFECEEMADSEAEEGSDSEPITDIQNEEVENVAVDADLDDEQCEPNLDGDPDAKFCGTSENHIKDRKVDNSSSSLCLNLNSCPPGSTLTENQIEVSKHNRSSWSRKDYSPSNRSIQNITPDANHATLPEQVLDLTEQPNLDSSVASLGKPRKRACSRDFRLSRSGSKRRKSGLNSDMNSPSSKHVSKNEPG